MKKLWALSVIVLAAGPVRAAVITETTNESLFTPGTSNQGWWSATQSNNNLNDNYFTGASGPNLLASFFTFDLSDVALTETIVGAELRPIRFSYNSPDATETIAFFDVSTAAAILNNNGGLSAAIYNDLSSGTSYGSFEVASYSYSNTERLTFTLNAAALADLNSARGGFFSIGGSLQSISPGSFDSIFSGSCGLQGCRFDGTWLVLTTVTSVPEPGTLALLGLGLAGLGLSRRRKTH